MKKINFSRLVARNNRLILAYEKKYAKQIGRALQKQLKDYLKTGILNDEITPVLTDMYMSVGERFYLNQYKLLSDISQKNLFIDAFKIWWTDYTRNVLAGKVTRINETTLTKLQNSLGDLVPQSLPFREMADQLANDFDFSPQRAMTISRTEVGNSMNEAKLKGKDDIKEELGEEIWKIWIHRGSKNPRDWHIRLDDGKAIHEDDVWRVEVPSSGFTEPMSRPHDPTASAENVINCGCEVMYIPYSYAKNNGMISATSYPITQPPPEPQEPQQRVNFVESKNKVDAERFLIENNLSTKVDYSKATLKQANEINEVIAKLDPKTPIKEVVIGSTKKKNVVGYYDPMTDKIVMSRTLGKGSEALNSFEPTDLIKKRKELILKGRANVPDYDYQLDYLDFNIKRYSRASAGNGSLKDSFIHEYGHRIDKLNNLSTSTKTAIENANIDFLDSMSFNDRRKWIGNNVSVYARVNEKELFAELYTMKQTGQKIPKELDAIITNIIKNAK